MRRCRPGWTSTSAAKRPEQTTHLARESGVAYIGAGHHATERGGVRALGNHLAEHFGVRHTFIDIPNPV